MKKTIIFLYLLRCILGASVWTSLEYIDVTENVTVYWTDVDLPNNATDTIGGNVFQLNIWLLIIIYSVFK